MRNAEQTLFCIAIAIIIASHIIINVIIIIEIVIIIVIIVIIIIIYRNHYFNYRHFIVTQLESFVKNIIMIDGNVVIDTVLPVMVNRKLKTDNYKHNCNC